MQKTLAMALPRSAGEWWHSQRPRPNQAALSVQPRPLERFPVKNLGLCRHGVHLLARALALHGKPDSVGSEVGTSQPEEIGQRGEGAGCYDIEHTRLHRLHPAVMRVEVRQTEFASGLTHEGYLLA